MACTGAEEHRELVRKCLRKLLEAGHSPLNYFQHDLKKYFYLAEVMSLIDLSLVCFLLLHLPVSNNALLIAVLSLKI